MTKKMVAKNVSPNRMSVSLLACGAAVTLGAAGLQQQAPHDCVRGLAAGGVIALLVSAGLSLALAMQQRRIQFSSEAAVQVRVVNVSYRLGFALLSWGSVSGFLLLAAALLHGLGGGTGVSTALSAALTGVSGAVLAGMCLRAADAQFPGLCWHALPALRPLLSLPARTLAMKARVGEVDPLEETEPAAPSGGQGRRRPAPLPVQAQVALRLREQWHKIRKAPPSVGPSYVGDQAAGCHVPVRQRLGRELTRRRAGVYGVLLVIYVFLAMLMQSASSSGGEGAKDKSENTSSSSSPSAGDNKGNQDTSPDGQSSQRSQGSGGGSVAGSKDAAPSSGGSVPSPKSEGSSKGTGAAPEGKSGGAGTMPSSTGDKSGAGTVPPPPSPGGGEGSNPSPRGGSGGKKTPRVGSGGGKDTAGTASPSASKPAQINETQKIEQNVRSPGSGGETEETGEGMPLPPRDAATVPEAPPQPPPVSGRLTSTPRPPEVTQPMPNQPKPKAKK